MTSKQNHKIFNVRPEAFEEMALETFRFQYANNPVYRAFADALQVRTAQVNTLLQIPFLPISFFKSHEVQTTSFQPQAIFESSGTTGFVNSRHFVKDLTIYRESFMTGFRHFYGDLEEWCIIGLLPSYLERNNSSLVVMVDELIKMSGHPQSGFYLNEHEKLQQVLLQLEAAQQKTLLIGVSFALLDFAEKYPMPLKYTVIMETGGMKGRREEMVRGELQEFLENSFQISSIHSEYGMTELLSQAYSDGSGIFSCPPWMKILLRDEDDPLGIRSPSFIKTDCPVSGIINVIDLANIYSCSFIATDDVGKLYANGNFEVLGRMDNSDIRGCSLMLLAP
jgi:phenylacetate-coenzyme A ligase PaaK-like adenylate-forming protein